MIPLSVRPGIQTIIGACVASSYASSRCRVLHAGIRDRRAEKRQSYWKALRVPVHLKRISKTFPATQTANVADENLQGERSDGSHVCHPLQNPAAFAILSSTSGSFARWESFRYIQLILLSSYPDARCIMYGSIHEYGASS
ncbi:hypothetical protein DPMN_100990 [Dreissena polymorpha]|uniref:Uncharacterized protein n=1 Tax=Dreissena polymorpha TaxID=45954 RepID=A0A9D4LGQ4_DREPO|nr:hypothetical protein DPMN_100990 [Dreissena polymorpha]